MSRISTDNDHLGNQSTTALEFWLAAVESLLYDAENMPVKEKAQVLTSLCSHIEGVLNGFKPNEQTYALWFKAAKDLLIAYQALSRNEDCARSGQHILDFPLEDEDRRTIDELVGMTLMMLGQPQKALSYFEEGLSIAERITSTSGTLSILQNIAKAYKQTGSYRRAIASLERAEAIMRQSEFDQEGNEFLHINNLIEIASIHREMANTTAARPYLQMALEAIDLLSPYETITQIQKASALTNLGLLDSDEGNYDGAVKVQEEALKIYKSGDFIYLVGLAQVETNLAVALTGKDDVEQAIAHWEESLSLNRQIGDTFRVSRALWSIAELEAPRGNYGRCLALLAEALELKRTLDDFDSCSRILFNMARVHSKMGHWHTALAELEESSTISESVSDFELSAKSFSEYANICVELKDVGRTATFRKRAAAAWRMQGNDEAADREELLLIEGCLDGDCNELLEQPIDVLDRISRSPTLGVPAIYAKARLLLAEGRIDDALSTLNAALEMLSRSSLDAKAIFHVNRGVLLGELNQIEKAVNSFKAGLDLIDSVSDLRLQGELWSCMGNSFCRMKKQGEAYIYWNHALECFRRTGAHSKVDEINSLLLPINAQAVFLPNLLYSKELWEYGLSRKSGWTPPKEAGVNLLAKSSVSKMRRPTTDPDLHAVEEVISAYHELRVWEDPNLGIFNPTIDFYTESTRFRGRTLINPLALTEGCLHFFFFRSDPLGKLAHVLDTCSFVGSGNVIFCSLPFLEKLANYLPLGKTGTPSEQFDRMETDYAETLAEVPMELPGDAKNDLAKTLAELTRRQVIQSNRTLIDWVLAHEIGHAALGHPSRFLDYSPSSTAFEQEADDFFINCYRHLAFVEAPGLLLHINLSNIIINIYHDYYVKEYGHPYTESEWVTTDAPIHVRRDESPHEPLIIRLLNLVDLLMKHYPNVDPTDYFTRVRKNITVVEIV